jgi:hypothetical protein
VTVGTVPVHQTVAGDGRAIVRTGPTTLYAFYAVPAGIIAKKSVNNGLTWEFRGLVNPDTGFTAVSVWHSNWTSGLGSNVVSVVCTGTGLDLVSYREFNIAFDAWMGSVSSVFTGASATTAAVLSITYTRSDRIYVAYNIDGGTEVGVSYSDNGGATWTPATSPIEAAADYFQLLPGNHADQDDVDLYFWDASANEISRKTYDASADTWAETSVSGSMTELALATSGPQFSCASRQSDGKQFLAAWSEHDTAAADLRFWEDDAGSLTARTNVVTNADDCRNALVSVDQSTGRIYVFYLGKSDGSQTAGSSLGLYYKYSDDDGVTWSSEVEVIADGGDAMYLVGGVSFSGGFPPVGWVEDVSDELIVPVELPPVAGGMLLGAGVRRASTF